MRRAKIILLFAVSVFFLMACGGETVSDSSASRMVTEGTINQTLQVQSTQAVGNADYEEYLRSLNYLEEIESEMSEAVTTAEMVSAAGDALAAWDKELNKIYGLLIERLPEAEKEELRAIQQSWIKERDQAAEQYAATFEGGSFATVAYNDVLYQWTKQRTLELIAVYFENSGDFSFDKSLGSERSEMNEEEMGEKSISPGASAENKGKSEQNRFFFPMQGDSMVVKVRCEMLRSEGFTGTADLQIKKLSDTKLDGYYEIILVNLQGKCDLHNDISEADCEFHSQFPVGYFFTDEDNIYMMNWVDNYLEIFRETDLFPPAQEHIDSRHRKRQEAGLHKGYFGYRLVCSEQGFSDIFGTFQGDDEEEIYRSYRIMNREPYHK